MKVILLEELTANDKKEIEKISKSILKSLIDDLIIKKIKENGVNKELKNMVNDVLEDFYKTIWTNRSFWKKKY